MEIWKNIEGYEGRFQVSNLGRVKSMNYRNTGKEKLLPIRYFGEYQTVSFKYKRKSYSKLVHRLVAEAFIPNPDNKAQVDHINTIKTDNRVENLRWATQNENMNNPLTRQLLSTKAQGRKYPERQKPIIQSIMGIYVKRWDGICCIKSELNFSSGTICKSLKKNKKAYGFEWTYAS